MISLLAVALGAVVALSATLLAEIIRTRREHSLILSQLRYDSYLSFMLAFVHANDALHAISADGRDGATDVPAAMRDSGMYAARERLLATGSPEMVLAGETTFRSLLQLRDAVANRLPVIWPDYRPASDGIANAVWALRQAARCEFNGRPLDLHQLAALRTPDITERLHPDPGREPGTPSPVNPQCGTDSQTCMTLQDGDRQSRP